MIGYLRRQARFVGPGEHVSVNVPAQYPTIEAAVASLSGTRIAMGATVTVKVADGVHEHAAGMLLNHPDGDRIRVVGNEAAHQNCVLSFPPGVDGIVIGAEFRIGWMNGFTVTKDERAAWPDNSTGILVLEGGNLTCGTAMNVVNFYYSAVARHRSYLVYPGKASKAGDVALWAFVGSTLKCPGAEVQDVADDANGWGFGIQAEYGATVDCTAASATGCKVAGIAALSGSNVRAHNVNASNNLGSGLFVRDGATIEAHGATANNNGRYGVEVLADGRVYGTVSATGNTIRNFCNKVNIDNGALGARIVAEDGPLRVDNANTSSTYFNTSDGLQAEIFSGTGTAHWGLARGTSARLQVISPNTNAPGEIASKGAEVVRLRSNGGVAFQAFSLSASAVNYLQADSSAAGAGVVLSSQGADPKVSLILRPKGGAPIQLQIESVLDCASDSAAAAAGVGIGGLYRSGSSLRIRVA